MSFLDDIKQKIEEVDFSDIRLLVVGIFLVLLPLLILLFYSEKAKNSESRTLKNLQQYSISKNRKGFSFTSNTPTTAGIFSKTPKFFSSKKSENEWEKAIKRTQEDNQLPAKIRMLPKDKRDFWEANMDPQIRMANYEMENGKFDHAMKLCEEILDRDSNNYLLKFQASGNLCKMYKLLGNEKAYEKEFQRYLSFLEKIKYPGFSAGPLTAGMKGMQKLVSSLPKMRVNPQVRASIEKAIAERGLTGKMTVDAVFDQTQAFFLQLSRGSYQGGKK